MKNIRKIQKVWGSGTSSVITLPEEVRIALKLQKGDNVEVIFVKKV